ncbi:hypothetical protein J4466_05805 [Candidatus Pacearchaeota archaeon]|nr:hypothetical protein [uncultured archaeon]AQS29306.1 hypothetical protein [uncultured archaeon]MBS3092904.1 hypothetical protein [Candidatus Pacearchaeota archaeon]
MKFKEASYYKKLSDKKVHCLLCPHSCFIENGEVGKCQVRMNVNGSLKNMFYGKPFIVKYLKSEDIPLYHVLPGNKGLSLGIAGNNLFGELIDHGVKSYEEMQNIPVLTQYPDQILREAEKTGAKMIFYGYSEPAMFYEYMKDSAERAKKNDHTNNLKHVMISHGFINKEAAQELSEYIDAAVIDIKGMSDELYEKVYNARLSPILDAVKTLKENNIWIEIRMKVIPKFHSNFYDFRKLISWVVDNLGVNTPLHFIPYDYSNEESIALAIKARKIALNAGLHYVYTSKIKINDINEGNITFCHNCRKQLIIRNLKDVENKIVGGRCQCGQEIPGIWQ